MVSDHLHMYGFVEVVKVLILVLMEYGLWLAKETSEKKDTQQVLILVLMEYGLWLINH